MSKSSISDYAKALYQATENLSGKDLHQIIQNFAELLARQQLLKKTDRIIADFVKYAKRQEGIEEMTITSARELPEATLNKIKKAFADKAESTEKVDAGLLGGFVVRTEDKIFDASLKTQLVRLKQSLI
ncbi:MAG: ATP synthase F1 subunit delta [Candidatus Magasanikbacteria bacterium]|nr:ATP synthase F1 subunit delta [Candidatus Magasanikbacteria bacterium]